jgi:hypothetical protein
MNADAVGALNIARNDGTIIPSPSVNGNVLKTG